MSFTARRRRVAARRRGGGGLVRDCPRSTPGHVWVCAALSDGDRAAVRRSAGGRLAPPAATSGTGRPDAGHRPGHVRPRRTTGRQLDAVVRAPPAVRHPAAARLRRSASREQWAYCEEYNAAFADALADEAAPDAARPRAGLPPQRWSRGCCASCGRTCGSATSRTRRGHRRLLPAAARRHRRRACCPGCSVPTAPASSPAAGRQRSPSAAQRCWAQMSGPDGTTCSSRYDGRTTGCRRARLGVDGGFLRERRPPRRGRAARRRCATQVGDRQALVRVDRTELSKNIVRGLVAYRELLRRYPHWRGGWCTSPSPTRRGTTWPMYREYTGQRAAARRGDQRRVRHRRLATADTPRPRRLRRARSPPTGSPTWRWSTRSGTA